MLSSGRFFACSAVAVTLIYYLYRKRRKVEYPICPSTSKVPEESVNNLAILLHCVESSLIYTTHQCLEFVSYNLPSVAQITLCTNICLLEDKISVGHIPNFEQSETLPVIMSLTDLQPHNPGVETPVRVELIESSAESCSEHAHTPDSNISSSSPGIPFNLDNLPPGCFNDPKNDIYEDSPEELNGTMIPKVLIPSDMWAEAVDQDIWHETFCVPAHMGGVLIGRLGKNVRELKTIWGAEFCLNTCPGRQDTLVFKLSCPVKHKNEVLRWVARRFRMRPSSTPIGNPNQLKRYLPLGEPVPVQIRSLYAAKEFFLTIQDEEFVNYLNMQAELDKDYSSLNNFRMQLCEPVTSGTVAVVPHSQGFARALIISVYPTWPKTACYFLLDHGTFGIVTLNKLRKIRAKYMRTPFQAIHVSWAHAFPIFSDVPDIHILRTFFASGRVHAFAVRMETCCRASVAFGQPCPLPYASNGLLDVLVNACNSGLYMTVPLAIYPSRQSWLNGTNVPYYPFGYSAIDYSLLVGYIAEDASFPLSDGQQSENEKTSSQTNSLAQNAAPDRPASVSRSRGGVRPTVAAPPGNHRNGGRSRPAPQKENQQIKHTPGSDSKPINGTSSTENFEPKRRPLGVRNVRGSNFSGIKGTVSRGRGHVLPVRPRD